MNKLDYTDKAKEDMQRLKREEPKAFLKLGKLLEALWIIHKWAQISLSN